MDWPVIAVFAVYAALISTILSFALVRKRKIHDILKTIAAEIGLEPAGGMLFAWTRVTAFWNGMKVRIEASHLGKQHMVRTLRTALKTGISGRFYIRNRTSPPIRSFPHRSLKYWKEPPAISTLNSADLSLFASGADHPDMVMKLMASPAVRQLLHKICIEEDGELVLEGGELQVSRLTRVKFTDQDSATTDRVREMIQQEWDLIRTALSVLDPSKMQVSERQELALHCPYCKNELLESRDLIRCSQCNALHHSACWTEHGRCSTFGCSGSAMPFVKEMAPIITES